MTNTNSTKTTQKSALSFVIDNFGANCPADVLDKLKAMLAQVEKKSVASGERKPSARQIENAGIKDAIVAEMEVGKRYTISEMLKQFSCFDDTFTGQRVSALVGQLVTAGAVVRIEDKRKTYFALPEAE